MNLFWRGKRNESCLCLVVTGDDQNMALVNFIGFGFDTNGAFARIYRL
jgi:hypothetical protein